MQIQNNYSVNTNYNPNFMMIKSVRSEGLYKKYLQKVNDLVDALKNNDTAMELCKKYDVDIVFTL